MLIPDETLLHKYFSSQWEEGVSLSVTTVSTHTWIEDFEISIRNCEQSHS